MPQVIDQTLLDVLITKFGTEKGKQAYDAIMKAKGKNN
tara:strand:+ start:98 stop:211 length:114 start_codon:yes stop_codon:yes gene_type:complete